MWPCWKSMEKTSAPTSKFGLAAERLRPCSSESREELSNSRNSCSTESSVLDQRSKVTKTSRLGVGQSADPVLELCLVLFRRAEGNKRSRCYQQTCLVLQRRSAPPLTEGSQVHFPLCLAMCVKLPLGKAVKLVVVGGGLCPACFGGEAYSEVFTVLQTLQDSLWTLCL